MAAVCNACEGLIFRIDGGEKYTLSIPHARLVILVAAKIISLHAAASLIGIASRVAQNHNLFHGTIDSSVDVFFKAWGMNKNDFLMWPYLKRSLSTNLLAVVFIADYTSIG